MPIRIVCTHCEKTYNVSETTEGKQVRCKNCGEYFKARTVAGARPALTDDETTGIRSSKRSVSVPAAIEDESPRPHRRREEEEEERPRSQRRSDDEEGEERPRRRARSENGGPGVGLWIGLGVGVLGLVVLGIVGAFFLLGDDADIAAIRQKHGDRIAELATRARREGGALAEKMVEQLKTLPFSLKDMNIDDDFLQAGGGFAALPGIRPNPVNPNPIIPNPVNPLPNPGLVAEQINSAADALAYLRSGDPVKQNQAMSWLRNADPNVAERAEIARLLDGLQNAQNLHERHFVLVRWATKEQVPTLVQYAEGRNILGAHHQCREEALLALGRLQDDRGLKVVVDNLGDFFRGNQARQALELYGDRARPAVISHFFHKDANVRNHIQTVAKKIGLNDGELLPVALQELQGPVRETRNAVCDWLAKTPVVPPQQKQVAVALDPLLGDNDCRSAALRALETWATKDNIPSLTKQVQDGPARREAMKVLGNLKDESGATAVASQLTTFFERGQALETLRTMGKEAAWKATLQHMNDRDGWVHTSVRKQLKDWEVDPAELVKQTLQDIADKDSDKRRTALDFLAKEAPVDSLRTQVQQAVQPLLADNQVQGPAYAAYFNWIGKDGAPALIQMVVGDPSPRRHEAMTALARMKEVPNALPAIASRLPNIFDRRHAAQLLKEVGKEAEPLVRQCLGHQDGGVRQEACSILKEIGSSAESLKALQIAAQIHGKDRRFVQLAMEAFQNIQLRMQANPQPGPNPVPKVPGKK